MRRTLLLAARMRPRDGRVTDRIHRVSALARKLSSLNAFNRTRCVR